MRLSDIIKHIGRIFEKKRKNPIQLDNDSNLESNLKHLKVSDQNTPIQISEDTINVQGSLTVNGTSVSTEPDDDSAVITALNNATANELVTVGATTTELDAEANLLFDGTGLKIKEAADASSDTTAYGQLWVHNTTPCDLMFTDDAGNDIIVSRPKNTAVWGGNFARTTGHNGKWLGIPTGYQAAIISFGTTDSAPDTTYSPSTTADDLCSVIWKTVNGFEVTGVQIFFAQGGATNTAHRVCLMRYDIDADGDLTNGAEVCDVTLVLNSDDYSHLRFSKPDLTSDVEVSSTQVLIAMVYCVDAINNAMSAKCIIEYKESIV